MSKAVPLSLKLLILILDLYDGLALPFWETTSVAFIHELHEGVLLQEPCLNGESMYSSEVYQAPHPLEQWK